MAAGCEVDVLFDGERVRAELLRRDRRVAPGVDAHLGEIRAEARLETRAYGPRQGLAGARA